MVYYSSYMKGKELHDLLLTRQPEGATHTGCAYCVETATEQKPDPKPEKVYDQETVDALVDRARATAEAEAQASVDSQLAQLQSEKDATEALLEEANEKIVELEKAIADRDKAAQLQELGDERATQVLEIVKFSDEIVAARKAQWASLSEEAFDGMLEDYKVIAAKAPKPKEKGVKKDTALTPVREAATDEIEEGPVAQFLRAL